jgi:hypothetical protein
LSRHWSDRFAFHTTVITLVHAARFSDRAGIRSSPISLFVSNVTPTVSHAGGTSDIGQRDSYRLAERATTCADGPFPYVHARLE